MAFYFVSQRNQKNENEMGKLTAPDNKKYEYIKNTRKDDLIIQYNSVSHCITGVANVNKNPYVSDDNIYIDVDIYTFVVTLPKNLWIKQLREKQNGLKTPVNENLSINSRYLQKMNTESFDYILDVAEKNSANKDVVQKIRNMSKSTPSYDIDDTSYDDENDEGIVMQKILFGAPGTGKSHTIKSKYLADVPEENTFRTTFHPDYDYAQFVGSYKPKKENGTITYSFVPQVFAKAYKRAKETSEPVYLVIEEINRGNCAQIFGDIFQLLDRNESGESQYEIDVDSDFAEWLGESKIKLPRNFNILATMNTSDQSLFPMDSAFKRRFDWEYVPIRYFKDASCGDNWNADGFEIKLDEHTSFSWLHFLKKINADIYKVTESEDKQMGEFFVKPKDNVIDLEMFRSKVLFYLWDSVYKDEPDKRTIFHFNYPEKNGSRVTFQSLFSDDANAIEIIKQMMKNLDKAYESKDDSEFKNFKIVSEQ